jgi:ATP-dependent protease HslVU (ClpYQ) peptidase subunit
MLFMTVIAFDGITIAADKCCVVSGLKTVTTKIFKVLRPNGKAAVVAISGSLNIGLMLIDWFKNGEILADWPSLQDKDELWTRLIVLDANGLYTYDNHHQKIPIESDPVAFGTGRDFALGAMSHGASAVEAVFIASQLSDSCGMGVDFFSLADVD